MLDRERESYESKGRGVMTTTAWTNEQLEQFSLWNNKIDTVLFPSYPKLVLPDTI